MRSVLPLLLLVFILPSHAPAQVSDPTLFYLPLLEGADSGLVGLAISNPTLSKVTVTLTAHRTDGAILTGSGITNPATLDIPASGQRALLAREVFGAGISGSTGWAEISSPVSTLAGFFTIFNSALTFVDSAPLERVTSSRLVFPRVQFGTTSTTTLFVVNTNHASPAQLRISYFNKSGGTPFRSETPVLAAGGSMSIAVSGLFSGNAVWDGFALVESVSGGIVGFETYRNLSDNAALNAVPADAVAATGYVPHLATQGGYATTLTLLNPTGTTQTVRIIAEALERGGAPNVPSTVSVTRTMSANSALIEPVSALFGLTGDDLITGYVKWEVLNETAGLFGLVDYGSIDGSLLAAVPGQGSPTSDLLFAHVAQGAGYYTGLAFLNPHPDPVSLDIEVFDRNGASTGSAAISLMGGARIARLLHELVPFMSDQVGGYVRAASSLPIFAFELFGSDDGPGFLANVPAHAVELPPQPSGEVVLATQGAVIYSEDLRASLSVPAGALRQDTALYVVSSSIDSLPAPVGQEIVSIVRGLPSDVTFSVAATLKFPLSILMPPGVLMPVLTYAPEAGSFLTTEFSAMVDSSGRFALARITHLTTFVLAVPLDAAVSVTAVEPAKGREGDAVTLTGSGFSANSSGNNVLFSGAGGTVQARIVAASATSLLVIVPAGAQTGSVIVRVGDLSSNAVAFEVLATPVAPRIDELAPDTYYVGVPAEASFEIIGSGFRADSTVRFNNEARPFTFIDSTRLSMELEGPIRIGSNEVVVINPGGISSNSKVLSFQFLTPVIASLTPSTVPSDTPTEVTIRGTGFIENSIVMLDNGKTLSKRFIDDTTMVVTTPVFGGFVWYNLFIIQVAPNFGPQSNKVRLTFSPPLGQPAKLSMGVAPKVPVNSEATIGVSIRDANNLVVPSATNPITVTITFDGVEVSRQIVLPENGGAFARFTPAALGRYNVAATAEGVASATAFFDATEDAYLTLVAGNNQVVPVDTELPVPLRVRLADSANRPIAGKEVSFAPFNLAYLRETRVTDANGEAVFAYRAGGGAGAIAVTATYSLSSVNFSLTVTPGPPEVARLEWLYLDPESSLFRVGKDRFFHLFVTDRFANRTPLDPARVTLESSAPATLSYPGVMINGFPSGVFRPVAYGPHTVTFRYAGIATPYTTFVDVIPAATPTRLLIVSGNNQTGVYNSLLQKPFRVVAVDASDNPIPGVNVTFRSLGNNGSFGDQSKTTVATDASGIAETQARLGADVGQQTFEAGVASGPQVTFFATSVAGPSAQIRLDSDAAGVIAGVTDVTFTVRLLDQAGHLVLNENPDLIISFIPDAAPVWLTDTGWLGGVRKKTMRFGRSGIFEVRAAVGALTATRQQFWVSALGPSRVKLEGSASTVNTGQSVTFATWVENQLGQVTPETPTWYLATNASPGVPLDWTPVSLSEVDGVIRVTFIFESPGTFWFKSRWGGLYFQEWRVTVQ